MWLKALRPSWRSLGRNGPRYLLCIELPSSSGLDAMEKAFVHSFLLLFPVFHWAPSTVLSTKCRPLHWSTVCHSSQCPWWQWRWRWLVFYIVHHLFPRQPWARQGRQPGMRSSYLWLLVVTLLSSPWVPYLSKITGHRQIGLGVSP